MPSGWLFSFVCLPEPLTDFLLKEPIYFRFPPSGENVARFGIGKQIGSRHLVVPLSPRCAMFSGRASGGSISR